MFKADQGMMPKKTSFFILKDLDIHHKLVTYKIFITINHYLTQLSLLKLLLL